ncbi:uncharacterized protein LOC129317828 isoform X2 [Prosopis cineraria]|uniref:uncharacterized protein LOC129317828 isoform X2 n=1 Tax=Prosopis cineraria TaxID=364024 RepID=UPI0024107F21|nr:uncharacterized protein LOC129317828 isoform X2 [Prosopis cineraria]
MASASSIHQRRLQEFLRERQEPFILHNYLSERGCSKAWNLQRSANSCLNMNAKLLFSRVLTSLYKKLALQHNESSSVMAEKPAVKDEDLLVHDSPTIGEIVLETDSFSSSSNSTMFYSCSEIDEDEISSSSDTFPASHVCPTGTQRLSTTEDTAGDAQVLPHSAQFLHAELQHLKMASLCLICNFQLISFLVDFHVFSLNVAVCLAEVAVNQDVRKMEKKVHSCSAPLPKKMKEESISSAAIWGLLMQSVKKERSPRKLGENLSPNASHGLKSKRILQKTKQLLFYCARETLPRKDKGQRCFNQYLGPQQLGRFFCKRTNIWDQRSRHGRGLTCFFSLDDLNSVYQWSDLEPRVNDIVLEIADAILEFINNEFVSEFIQYKCSH